MPRFTLPRRRTASTPPAPAGHAGDAVKPGSADPAKVERLRADLKDARNALGERNTENSLLRRQVRQLKGQLRAGAAMLAAASRDCEQRCPHASLAAERGVQLEAMQARLDELQAANEAHDRHGPGPVYGPAQRRERR